MNYLIGNQVTFSPVRFSLFTESRETRLSAKESALLLLLCLSAPSVITRTVLMEQLWKNGEGSDNNLNKNVLMLRRKFEGLGIRKAIETISGIGYLMSVDVVAIDSGDELDIPDGDSDSDSQDLITRPSVKKIYVMVGLLLASVVLAVLWYRHVESRPTIKQQTGSVGILYYPASTTHSIEEDAVGTLDQVFMAANGNKLFRAMISNETISIIAITQDEKKIEMIFMLDTEVELTKQLACAANRVVTHAIPNTNATMIGITLNRDVNFIFAGKCLDNKELLQLNIKHLDSSSDKKFIFEQFEAIDPQGKKLLHFTRSATKEVREKGQDYNSSFKYDPASLTIDAPLLVAKSPEIVSLLEEFLTDKINIITLDSDNRIFATDAFGGILLYTDVKSVGGQAH